MTAPMRPSSRPYEISPADRSRALMELQLHLSRGDSPDECVRFLMSRGFKPDEARAKVEGIVAESLRADRRKGAIWLACALACFVLAAPLVYGVVGGVTGGHLARGYLSALGRAGTLPGLLIVAGCAIGFRGLMLVLRRTYRGDPD